MKRILESEDGATTAEYAVILGLICTTVLSGLFLLGNHANNIFASVQFGTTAKNVAPTPKVPEKKTAFNDSFSDPKLSASQWDLNGSWWKFTDGELQITNGAWNSFAYAQNSSFTDGTIAFDAELTKGSGYGIMFHLSGDPVKEAVNGYSFQYDPGYGNGAFVLRKWVNGYEINPPISVTYPAAGFQWTGTTRHVELTTQGSRITASVDGKTVMTANDSTYASGGVGLTFGVPPLLRLIISKSPAPEVEMVNEQPPAVEMVNEQPAPEPDIVNVHPPAVEFSDWMKDTRERLGSEEPLAQSRLSIRRPVPNWIFVSLMVAAVGTSALAWLLPAPVPIVVVESVEVRGRILDIDGRPVAGALVFLAADPRVETRIELDGSFLLNGVPLGKQSLVVVQEDMGEEYDLKAQRDTNIDLGELVYRVPPMSVRRAPGGGADWGKK